MSSHRKTLLHRWHTKTGLWHAHPFPSLSVFPKELFTTRRTNINGAIHISAWILYTLYEVLILFLAQGKINVWEAFFNSSINAALFYLNALVLLPLFFSQRRYFQYTAYLLIALGLYIGFKYVLKMFVTPLFDQDLVYPYISNQVFLAQVVWRGGHFTMFSFGYWFATSLIRSERDKRRLEQQKRKDQQQLHLMEKSVREAEITYLKNQINPHFLFNTLNFFYEQVRPSSPPAGEGILLLSRIMRYALKESEVNAKVMLSDEIQHLKNYINLNQLRFSDQLQVRFDVQGDPRFRMILPLVLITFVENCFKYGDLHDPHHPLTINLHISDDQLQFSTCNRKKLGPIESSCGIGLSNTRKRLNMVYGERHRLTVDDQPDSYAIQLTINL